MVELAVTHDIKRFELFAVHEQYSGPAEVSQHKLVVMRKHGLVPNLTYG
jgi:hypothetical protein